MAVQAWSVARILSRGRSVRHASRGSRCDVPRGEGVLGLARLIEARSSGQRPGVAVMILQTSGDSIALVGRGGRIQTPKAQPTRKAPARPALEPSFCAESLRPLGSTPSSGAARPRVARLPGAAGAFALAPLR